MRQLEHALQTVLPDANPPVALPYWDQTSKKCQKEGIPKLLTDKKIRIGLKYYKNPFLFYRLPDETDCSDNKKTKIYYKSKGYATNRYPYDGLTCPDDFKASAQSHNRYLRLTY